LHDIDPKVSDQNFMISCVIEIPAGTETKFEVDIEEKFNSIKPDMKNGKIRKLRYKGDGDPKNQFTF
jgi:inorganic pyrophosphatase